MPIQPDYEQRIAQFRAELLDAGLEWHKHYFLYDEGSRWAIDYTRPMTDEQYNVAEAALKNIMNSQKA